MCVAAIKEASVACYERENRFHDTNWSKSVLHTLRIDPRAFMFMTRPALIRLGDRQIDRRSILDRGGVTRMGNHSVDTVTRTVVCMCERFSTGRLRVAGGSRMTIGCCAVAFVHTCVYVYV